MVNHKENEVLQSSNNRGSSIDISSKPYYNNISMEKVKLLSIDEVAKTLGISRNTVYAHMNSGELNAIKLDNRTMIRMSDLLVFIENRNRYLEIENAV